MFRRVYLDWNATAPLLDVARKSFVKALDFCGNPSSVHREGQKTRFYIEESRRIIADFCGAKSEHIIFTSSATESANWVLTPNFYKGSQKLLIDSLYISAIEHPAVYSGGHFPSHKIHKIPVLSEGIVDLKALADALENRDSACGIPMIAIMLVNNETGVIQPITEVSRIVKKYQGILVVDAVQAAGRIPLSIEEIGADFLIISSHKLGAPIGSGALIFREDTLLPSPLLRGGDQEKGHRAGTENYAVISGFAAAAQYMGKDIQKRSLRITGIRNYLEKELKKIIPNIIIYGEDVQRISNTCCFSIPFLKAEVLQIALDLEGIAVSAGSACSSGKTKKNHVLNAMGYDTSTGALRISCGDTTTQEDIDVFLKALYKIVRCSSVI
ncbi:cysteine desulfurase [Candidatus Liberibacter africanus]|uniref:Cysteine desulfurase n=1 Tax=Candidatus Liberibacter africanus PTSAPSY TaxID=1277257 RepID=A0A0G3I7U5_LIBAF|nr:cysteine desulfurase family protein [Candidatus Liberibacter africanus]AKK20628.1 putative pyridoxal-phosphate-dependent aminotransferase protein [Candidatus Liberibacter africanus PTSAPSY]QTP64310.1 cysteine desulfurase [Candidatus Liberibacter africanus]